jgi:pimeloyl-ACP methyl ester carboxylesterase
MHNKPQASRIRVLAAQFSLLGPLSSASVPLLYGLSRRIMLQGGATRHEARLGGMSINYFQQAPTTRRQGPPLLLVHGIADNALTWALVMRLLAYDHPVYAIDLPGYGLSGTPAGRRYATLDEMREVLALFIREVIGRPGLVVGNSMGGWLAVKLAWSAPELVRALVLLDAGGAPLQGRVSWEPFAELIGVRDLKSSRVILRQMFGAVPAPLLYLGQRGLQELFQRQVVRDFVANLAAAATSEEALLRPDELRRLPAPAALVWGRRDTFLPPGSLEFFRENMPGAPTLLLRRCGHMPQRERPLAVARFIRRYAAQIVAEEPASNR